MSYDAKYVAVLLSLWLFSVTCEEIRIKIDENLSPGGAGCNHTKATLVVSCHLGLKIIQLFR